MWYIVIPEVGFRGCTMTTLDQEQLYAQRCLAVKWRREEKVSFSEIGRRLGHSRQWASRWCRREDLHNRSSRPHHSPHRVAEDVEQYIVARGRGSGWGRYRLHRQLAWELRDKAEWLERLPSPSGIERIRRRHGLVQKQKPRAHRPSTKDYGGPNELWEGDILEKQLADGKEVLTYKLIDCGSRMELLSYSAASIDTGQVIGCVLEALRAFGMPKAIQHDNGTQFCDTQHREMGGKLDLVLEHLGVESRHIPRARPEHNGVIERLMRTTQEEGVKGEEVETEAEYRERMASFQHTYNELRCHTAVGKPPSFSYSPSERSLPGGFELSQVKPGGKGKIVSTRRVYANGCIQLRGQEYPVGRAYKYRTVGVELSGEVARVVLKGQLIKELTLKPLDLKCDIGPCTIARYRPN